jgi:multicomponent Na+:H+ antiporter subunit F
MNSALFLEICEDSARVLLALAVIFALVRLIRGPGLADRIVALDLLTTLAISLIGVTAMRVGVSLLVDIAVALCLVGFVSTVALARFLLLRRPAPPARQGRDDSTRSPVIQPMRSD